MLAGGGTAFLAGGHLLRAAVENWRGANLWEVADADIFICGCITAGAFVDIVSACAAACEAFAAVHMLRLRVVLSERSITFVMLQGAEVMQQVSVSLRPYVSIADVLSHFDMPCVQIATDGKRVFITKLMRLYLENGYQVVRFRSADSRRIIKYAYRGFPSLIVGGPALNTVPMPEQPNSDGGILADYSSVDVARGMFHTTLEEMVRLLGRMPADLWRSTSHVGAEMQLSAMSSVSVPASLSELSELFESGVLLPAIGLAQQCMHAC
jgi:hypothetical protein